MSAKLFSELKLVTDNLLSILCSSQLRSHWKEMVTFWYCSHQMWWEKSMYIHILIGRSSMSYSWHQRVQGHWITVSSMCVTFGSLLSLLNLWSVHTLFHGSTRSHFDVHAISSHTALLSTTSHTIQCIYNTSLQYAYLQSFFSRYTYQFRGRDRHNYVWL